MPGVIECIPLFAKQAEIDARDPEMRAYAEAAETEVFLGAGIVVFVGQIFDICRDRPAIAGNAGAQVKDVVTGYQARKCTARPRERNTVAETGTIEQGIKPQGCSHGRILYFRLFSE